MNRKVLLILFVVLWMVITLCACRKNNVAIEVPSTKEESVTMQETEKEENVIELETEEVIDWEVLLNSTDINVLVSNINSIEDCLNYLSEIRFTEGEVQKIEETIETKVTNPQVMTQFVTILLAGDYDEMGILSMEGAGSHYSLVAIQKDDMWTTYDTFQVATRNKYVAPYYSAPTMDELINLVVSDGEYRETEKLEYKKSWGYVEPKTAEQESTSAKVIVADSQTPTKKNTHILNVTEYTDDELMQFISTNPTLDEAAEKIHTAKDAVRFLKLAGYRFDYCYNPQTESNGVHWGWVLSAQFTYNHMAGSCGGTSNLMNRLLAGDYDEQGYIRYFGQHILNYIKTGDTYHICDFTRALSGQGDRDPFSMYCIGSYTDTSAIAKSYAETVFPGQWNDPNNNEQFLYLMYMYPRDGKNALPISSGKEIKRSIIPKSIENVVIILYLADGYSVEFVDYDVESNRPSEADVPDDAHFDYKTGQRK